MTIESQPNHHRITNFSIMKQLLQKTTFLLFLIFAQATGMGGNISMCTWNLKDFGNTKNDSEIKYIAGILKNYDINAIQEVVAKSGGTSPKPGKE